MSESSVEPVVELQEVGRVSDLSALSLRERRECWPVAVIARREEWPTSQLTQRICLQQQGMSQQMVEVGLAAVGEDLQAVAEALHTCQAAHAQVARCMDIRTACEISASSRKCLVQVMSWVAVSCVIAQFLALLCILCKKKKTQCWLSGAVSLNSSKGR
ncbi:uncharacterized protein LOC142559710 isoform X1 [Dermacentor variabilis]|uniref:uncharacterized protein LOC142559710 isoform X1 n=1 Tax=Dermacentor variabilis TaxID=34621 RepID=UPI003F5B6881